MLSALFIHFQDVSKKMSASLRNTHFLYVQLRYYSAFATE